VDKDSLVFLYCTTERDNEALKEKIILSYGGFVTYIARKLSYAKDDVEDLIQVGTIGLLKSLERYEPQKDVDFSSFATPNIIGEIRHYFRDKSRILKIPRRLHELYTKIKAQIKLSVQETGKSPTVSVLAEKLQVTEEEILESLEAGRARHVLSLDRPAYGDASLEPESLPTMVDQMSSKSALIEDEALDRESLEQILSKLSVRDRKIVHYRFYDGLTQLEIANKLHISQMQVSRILLKTVSFLKKNINR